MQTTESQRGAISWTLMRPLVSCESFFCIKPHCSGVPSAIPPVAPGSIPSFPVFLAIERPQAKVQKTSHFRTFFMIFACIFALAALHVACMLRAPLATVNQNPLVLLLLKKLLRICSFLRKFVFGF